MIKLQQIVKTYNEGTDQAVPALKGVSLEIGRGEIFGVIGLSGAGKSTLIRIINMLEVPSSGSVVVDGVELTTLPESKLREMRRSIGMIFQQFNLLSSATVKENVAFPLRLDKTLGRDQIENRVSELLDMVGLGDKGDFYPAQLSGGQKQRVGIARALATNPKILLCDEATSALDPKTTSSILELLIKLRDLLNLTIVIITHQMEVIKECCDKVAVLDGGVIAEQGTVVDIFSSPRHELTARLVNSAVRKDVLDTLEHMTLITEYREGGSAVVELLFLGSSANDPVIVETAELTGASISILAGSIHHFHGEILGILVVGVAGTQEIIDKALETLRGRVYRLNFLGYEVKTPEESAT
ncbi:MAG: ATP-binding cassette domain-containing protein [Succinivibrio sp.]|nr:ATP-binding cassette domain-containing protein [Succinivibrio sp.]